MQPKPHRLVVEGRIALSIPLVLALVLSLVPGWNTPALATGGPISYVYDEVGRLTGVIDPSGDAAKYVYDPVGNLLSIDRHNSSTISVMEFTPNNGPVGKSVTIQGTAFGSNPGDNTVKFNGTTASVVSASPTKLVATVPVGATTGNINVTTAAGTASSTEPFTVNPGAAPSLAGFTPTVGASGSTVTLTGSNFDASPSNNKVSINSIKAVVDSTTATTISAIVPTGTTSGRVRVTTPHGKSQSAGDFFVPPPGFTSSQVEYTGRIASGEQKNVAIATGTKIGVVTFDGTAGDRFSLNMTGVTISSSTVSVFKPNSGVLVSASVTNAGGFLDSQALPSTGTYSVLVDPASTYTGSMNLSLSSVTDVTGNITPGGPSVVATTTVPGQNGRFTFQGSTGQRVAVNATGGTYGSGPSCGLAKISLLGPDRATLVNGSCVDNAGFVEPQVLPSAGTYTVLVDPQGTKTGSLTISLLDVVDVSGTIVPGGASLNAAITVPGQNGRFVFSASAGQKVSLQRLSSTISSGNIRLRHPDGSILGSVSASTSSGGFIDATVLPVTGTYWVEVDPSAASIGTATLALYAADDVTGTITAGGSPVTVSTSIPGQNFRLTFPGGIGQRIGLNMTGSTFSTAFCAVSFNLLKPDGSILSGNCTGNSEFVDPVPLPVAGTYIVSIDPASTYTGSITTTLYDVVDISGNIAAGGSSVTVANTTPGQNAKLTFSANAGDKVSLLGSGSTFGPSSGVVQIIHPNGQTSLGTSALYGGAFIDANVLPVTGNYTILVDPMKASLGTISLSLYAVNDTTTSIIPGGQPVIVSTNTPGQNAKLSFSGTAGQRVSLATSSSTMPSSGSVSLKHPNGTVLGSVGTTSGLFMDAIALPVTGLYTILVDTYANYAGSITLTLHDVVDVGGTLTIGGSSSTISTTIPGQNAGLTFSGDAGRKVRVQMTAVSITSSSVKILKPDGLTLASMTVGTTGGLLDATLPTADTYRLVIDPSLNYVGGITVAILDQGTVTSTTPPDVTGSITVGGSALPMTIGTANQNGRVTFSGTAGAKVSLRATSVSISSSTLTILTPELKALASASVTTSGGFIDTQTLPATGGYTIFIDPQSTNTGSLTLALYDASDVPGTITQGGPAVTTTISSPGQSARITFAGNAGQKVSLNATNLTFSSASLSILSPEGTSIASTTGGSGPRFVEPITLSSSGTYTILVDPDSTYTGSATVSLYEVVDVAGSINPGGSSVIVGMTIPGQVARLAFSGSAAQRVSVTSSASTLAGSTTLRIYKPDGAVLASSAVSGSTGYMDVQTLPVSGGYALQVDPSSSNLGSITVVVNDAPDVSASLTPGGSPVTVTSTVPGQRASLTFNGSPGQRVSVKSSNSAVSTATLSILSPQGTSLASAWGIPNSIFVEPVDLPLQGSYTLLVDPDGASVGSVTIALHDVADITGTVVPGGAAATAGFTIPGQRAKYTFSGNAGQKVSMKLSAVSIPGNAGFSLVKPDGTNLASASTATTTFMDSVTLPVTGTYIAAIDPSSDSLGSATVNVYNVVDITGTMIVDESETTVTTTVPGQNVRLDFSGTVGTRVNLSMTGISIQFAAVTIYNPDSTALVTTNVVPGLSNLTFDVASNGTHSLLIDPSGTYVGGMTLTLIDPLAGPDAELGSSSSPTATSGGSAAPAPVAPTSPSQGTSGSENDAADPEMWIPPKDGSSDWRSHRPSSPSAELELREAPAGVTALAGRVLTMDGRPLANVTLEIDDQSTKSDGTGRFLLKPLTPGHHELEMDGTTANKRGTTYGTFEAAVTIVEGTTNILPFTIWMPKIDTAHSVKIATPTTAETVVTSPYLPGLEVRIPAGAVVTDGDGEPVTELSLTPIPLDRTPFPLPENINFPMFFTIQPGGAYVSPFAQIIYPNYTQAPPGTRLNFWNYEPEDGWYIYGKGTVTPDGSQIVPDHYTRIYEFIGSSYNPPQMSPLATNPPGTGPAPGSESTDGDPVDLGTGLFVMEKTDLALPDLIPITMGRTYRQSDSATRPFGIGTTHQYQMFLHASTQNLYQQADLILPDGGKVHYTRTSAGTSFNDMVLEHLSSPSAFHKSKITWNGSGWDLKLKDGKVLVFGDATPLQAIRDTNANQVTITRVTPGGNITKITSPSGRWIDLTYDASNRITQAKDNSGRIVGYTYDASGRLWKATDPTGGVTEYLYDASHRMTSIKDARGIVFLQNEYDASGRVSRQTQADATTYQFTYTPSGAGAVTQTEVTNPRGLVRRVNFAGGYTTSDLRAVGTPKEESTTFERQAGTNLATAVIDDIGRRNEYAYDSSGNLLSATKMAGTAQAVTNSFTYEPKFNLVASSTDALNHTTNMTYNLKGNLTSTTDPTGRTTSFTYSPVGQPVTVTDPAGLTKLAYEFGDLVSVTDPLGRTSVRFTDDAGRPISTTDALGNTARQDYDALNRVTKTTDPMGKTTLFGYDPNGNMTSLTDARNHVTSFTYDSMDRRVTALDPLSKTESFTYDENGNLKTVTDRKNQTTTFTYDARDRRTQADFGTESSITYTWDDANRMISANDSGAGTIGHAIDDLDRLTQQTTPQGQISYGYDLAGRRTSMTVPGQAQVTYGYDNADRRTQITQGASTVSFGYDSAGRQSTLGLPNGIQASYGYDSASQLTSIAYNNGANSVGDLQYAYDETAKRATVSGSLARSGIPEALSSATYDAANRLTNFAGTGLTYDDNGNMTADGTRTLTWNRRNELTEVGQTGANASFSYDASGRRTEKTIASNTTGYLYDGDNAVQELAGTTPVANMLTGGTDQVFSRTEGSATVYPLTDALGSTVALADQAGAVPTSYTYEPYGATTQTGTTSTNPSQFTGRENDGNGLYFYRARYYNPTFGSFISQDPIGFGGGSSNLYGYTGQSPTNFTDSSGLIIDTIADIGFLGYDIFKLATGSRKDLGGNLTALGLDTFGLIIPFATGLGPASRAVKAADRLAPKAISVADDAISGVHLGRQLASSQQLAETGIRIAGPGSKTSLREATRLAGEYGGSPNTWGKMSSSPYRGPDGFQFETHWYENAATGQRVEFKTKFSDNSNLGYTGG